MFFFYYFFCFVSCFLFFFFYFLEQFARAAALRLAKCVPYLTFLLFCFRRRSCTTLGTSSTAWSRGHGRNASTSCVAIPWTTFADV